MPRSIKIAVVAHSSSQLTESHLKILETCDQILAADGGADKLRAVNLKPSMIVGDLDGVSSETLDFFRSRSEIYRFPHDKDETDLELSVNEAVRRGASELHIFCWADERIDYSLGSLLFLRNIKVNTQLYIKGGVVRILNLDFPTLKVSHPSKISVFSLSSDCHLRSSGLKWELNFISKTRSPLSQSNETLKAATINLIKGSAFCLLNT